jgi:hypothetical protein
MCIVCTFMCICCIYVYLLYSYVYLLYLCVFVISYLYLLNYVCIAVLTLDPGLLARSQYPEGPATGHLDTRFSWFPYVYKRMLRWFPSFPVATTCLSCSPPNLNSLVTFFSYFCTCKITTATGWQPNCSLLLLLLLLLLLYGSLRHNTRLHADLTLPLDNVKSHLELLLSSSHHPKLGFWQQNNEVPKQTPLNYQL